jgi:HEPN domain-containing protein
MPLDSARIAETKAWFAKAADDLRAADVDFQAQPPLLADVLFHAQQAAEKSLKGFLTWHDSSFRKTHDLGELGRACSNLDPTLEPICREIVELTVYAWIYRYPGDPDPPNSEEAEEATALSRRLVDELLRKLPPDVRA